MSTKTMIDVNTIDNALDSIERVNVRSDYSGRSMFGKTCFGIDFDHGSDVAEFFINLAEADADLARMLRSRMRQDSMGLGLIVYFPGISLDGRSSYQEPDYDDTDGEDDQ